MDTARIKTRPMLVIEARLGRPLEQELAERYFDRGQTQAQIGVALGIEVSTVSRWMRALGIPARFPGQKGRAA